MPDTSPQINTGTDLGVLATSLNDKSLDNKTYQRGERSLLETSEKVRQEQKETPLAKPPQLTEAPKQEDYQTPPMQKFGSFGMVLASLGSLMTRHPMASALNAGAEVMKAQNLGDANAYKDAMDKWKIHTDNAWKMADWEQKNFDNMRAKYKDDLDGLNREAEIWAAMTKNPALEAAVKAGQVQEYFDNHQKAVEGLKEHSDAQKLHADEKADIIKEWMEKNKVTDISKVPAKVSIMADHQAQTNAYNAAHGKSTEGDKFNFDFSSLSPHDIVPGLGLPLAVVDQKVQGLHDGMSYANLGIPMRTTKNPLKDAVDARLADKYPDFNYKEAQLNKAEQTRELASNAARTASAKAAVNEMDTLGKPMIDAMKNLNPDKYPDWNAVKNAYDKKTGGADVVKAFQAVQDFKTAFVSLMVKNGVPTDSARATSDDIASINFSLDQIEGVRDQAKITGAAVLDALDTTKRQIIGGKPSDISASSGGSASSPLPAPKDNKYEVNKYYDLGERGHGVHKYLGKGKFEE